MKSNFETDERLWQATRLGSELAFEALYRRYFQILVSYGKRIHPNEAMVNDAIQDLFIDIWRTRHSLGQAESVKFYLMSSLRRRILRLLKSDLPFSEEWDELPEQALPMEDSPETLFAEEEENALQNEKLNKWLEQLPPRQYEALLLRYFHNFEYVEIAGILNIKEQTARNLVQKALYILRKLAIVLIIMVLGFIF
ncbi:sigma-70 family RNA polymerase sigma factor [Runella sp. MFBS21]|uniref:RNA polymerase sigma factor n=1 Tax=Runella sp. MFBS21 TaxID=3034018 RepID=UPI0023F94DC6|nr:sigma-70 family RNA polymerase sigma factor [Runella sp. MFBS21]MDF7819871.1 sigma-70 family RNA polymerase sigma factor [Runella sp. MFBS21]